MIVEIKGWVGRESEEDIKENKTKGAQWVKVLATQAWGFESNPSTHVKVEGRI